jgi:beta-galactosidase
VTEYQPGWFDEWGGKHRTVTVEHFEQVVTEAVFKVNASLNFYMFIGGTNFGFMNGGHVITSYDYDAPLTESGLYLNSKNFS